MLKTTIIGLLFGTIGTTIGGILGIYTKRNSKKFLSFILSVASGLMLSVVSFSLIPEAMENIDISVVLIGIILGIVVMTTCESFVDNRFMKKDNDTKDFQRMLKTGIIVSVGLAIHNVPEGIAIGAGYAESIKIGLSIAIAICIHDIPEGLSMAIPLKYGGMKNWKIMSYVVLSGIATGIGALIGQVIGGISIEVVAICLSFAGGAMLYIVSGELIPEYNKLYQGEWSALGIMLGFLIGLLATVIG